MENISKMAWRSIWRNKRRTIITLISIVFGLGMAIFSIAMQDGAYHQVIYDGVRMQSGHITIQHKDYSDAPAVDLFVNNTTELRSEIEKLDGIEQTKIAVFGQGVAKSGNGSVGIGFMGVEPSLEEKISPIAEKIIEGEFLSDEDEKMAVIGVGLADKLKLKLGKKMVIATNDIDGNIVEELCRIKGIFKTGSSDTDGFLVLVPVGLSRTLLRLPDDAATQVGVIIENAEHLKSKLKEIKKIKIEDSAVVLPWPEVMPDLSAFIALDKGSNKIFMGIIIVLVLFTIFNTILMSIMERKREFAILLAIGTPPRQLEGQIVMESAFLGFIGSLLGVLVGFLVSYYYYVNGLDFTAMAEDDMSVAGIAFEMIIYPRATIHLLTVCGIIVFISTILLSLIPMRRASNAPFSDVLR